MDTVMVRQWATGIATDHRWDTDTAMVHHLLTVMDIVMDHPMVTDTATLHHMDTDIVITLDHLLAMDTVTGHQADTDTATNPQSDIAMDTAMDYLADTDTATDHQARKFMDTAICHQADMVIVIHQQTDMDMVIYTVLVHLLPTATIPSMGIQMVIFTKNPKFSKWQMLNPLLYNPFLTPLHSSKILKLELFYH